MEQFVARASAFFNGDFFYIMTQSTGVIAYPELDAPPYYLPPDADDGTLGRTVRLALKKSKKVDAEEFQKLWQSGVLQKLVEDRKVWAMKQYGYKTKRAMYRKMDNCSIMVIKGEIEIQPSHHDSLDGYSSTKDKGPFPLYLPETATNEELGAVLREGFTRCTSSVK